MDKLEKISPSTSLAVPISKPADILRCPSIQQQVAQHGREPVIFEISSYLQKAALALGVEMSNAEMQVLSEDLRDMYPHDALEDLREALKKGRRGQFGWGMHKRGKLSLPLIQDWMQQQLAEKAEAREQQHETQKKATLEVTELSPKVQQMLQEYRQGLDKRKQAIHQAHQNALQKEREQLREKKRQAIQKALESWELADLEELLQKAPDKALKKQVQEIIANRKKLK